ncbi:MAG: AAA family ATPase [Polaromonas sp.]|nr:AAA family ATPase [Polaromonas sp.]
MSNPTVALTPPDDAGNPEVVYESRTTRVYRPRHAAHGLILKEPLGADAAKRLSHEAGMLVRLAGVDGVIQLAGSPHPPGVLALQDCDGKALNALLQKGPLDVPQLLVLAPQLARSLAAIHRAGVIHRDINPANILLTPGHKTMVIDFDVAMLADQHEPTEPEGQIVGTLAYLPPEQTGRTGHAVDQRADLYALGATLYQMATGRVPFEAQDTLQLIHDHLVREPAAPSQLNPQVPGSLSRIILRLLAKAPEQRYQSAEGLLHDLNRLQGDIRQGADSGFELGERDFATRLAAPTRLVGRNAELALLRIALTEAMHTQRRTVLVEGAAGIGKSALIDQLRPIVAEAGGWFIHGKFDQYQKGAATSGAVTQAGRALGRLLLAQPLDELAAQRQRIMASLGRNAGLMTRMSPEFALLLGEQPEVPEVDPQQAELQLQQASLQLLAAVASPERPLVVVLDDLQWAGALSLRGIGHMMHEPALKGVLLIGAYRAEELDAGNVLVPMLAQWREHPQPPLEIMLGPLAPAGMAELIGQMLRLSPGRANELAQAVGELTGGNPFDTVEMINALRRDGVMYLADAGWQWNEAKVRHFVGRGNVVDLLAARVARVPVLARELLEYMSCLGNEVEFALLAAAAGMGESQLREGLRAPLEDGLLLADTSRMQVSAQPSLHFRHDRVQQAVLDAMDDAQRARRQLAMARRLAREPRYEGDAAQQYLACVAQLHDAQEQQRAAQLFFALAQKLTATATNSLAERYLAAAGQLLAAIGAPGDLALRAAIDAARHAALYSLGRLDESDPLYAAMLSHIKEPLDLVEPTCLQMRSLFMRGQTAAAKKLGVLLLEQLGLEVPQDYAAPDAEQRLDALNEWIAQDSCIDHPARPQITDKRLLAIAKLLGRMARPAYFNSDKNAFKWLLLEGQRLWAEHGPCAELVASLGRMTGMLISERADFKTAHDVAHHVLTVGQALGYEPQASEAQFIYSACAGHWFAPMEDVVRDLWRAYEGVLGSGDISYAGYVHAVLITDLLEITPTIAASAAEVDAGIELCQRAGNVHAGAQHICERQMLRALSGKTTTPASFDDAQFNEAAFLAHAGNLPYLKHTYAECRALSGLIMGNAEVLVPNALLGLSLSGPLAGYYMSVYANFLAAMARARQLQQAQAEGVTAGPEALAELTSCRNWLAARAADQPHNFLHLLRLVEAEQAWALGDLWRAAMSFDHALSEVDNRQRPWHRALITERAGLFQLAQGTRYQARELLAKAHQLYETWGATAKVTRMEREHEFLRARPVGLSQNSPAALVASHTVRGTDSVSPHSLDLVGVLRASQALSSETSLEKLTARVTDVLAALSGATDVKVLSWHEGQWCLLTPAQGEASISAAWAAECGLLPLSAVRYVERTNEPLLVDDASRDDRFARDPYFSALPFCSLLVAPISSQGSVRAMLLLENRLSTAAFNAQRLDAVMLIAGQLAVSLANAQLYENLEARVQARTRELEQTQAELVATARRAGKAEIANNVLHNVGNVLNSVNVSASVVRRNISESRAQGLARAVALMNEHEHDLPAFISHDPRGQALLGYLNELVGALQEERQNALGDLDRLARSVEHITYVVAMQQSHSGPSSVLESVQPQDIIEEAMQLCADVILRCGVTVVREFADVPAATLDKQRLLQILVNLIGNAAQAMEDLPQQERRLTLATLLERDASGTRLVITVQDEGEGIAADNLTRIFSHGFTTRQDGHGFGLHSAALAAMEMGATLSAHSDGVGLGAVFTLSLALAPHPAQAEAIGT